MNKQHMFSTTSLIENSKKLKRSQKFIIIGASVASLVASGAKKAPVVEELTKTGDVSGTPSAGNDKITFGEDGGEVDAGAGDDKVTGNIGKDIIDAGAGDDTVKGGAGNDEIDGGSGNDTLEGNEGNDNINGGSGNDDIEGGSGNDDIDGGTGNDTIEGNEGNDKINGGSGNDLIYGGPGKDEILGGAGEDSIVVIGVSINGTYDASDISNPNGTGIDLSSLISLSEVNDHSVSDVVAGELIDGGADGAILFIYGDVDLTGVTLSNLTEIQVQSTLTINAAQLNGLLADDSTLATISGDGTSSLIIADSDVAIEVNLSSLDLDNIEHLNIGKNVTLIADQADIAKINYIEGKGILKAAVGELELGEKVINPNLTILDSDGHAAVDFNISMQAVEIGEEVGTTEFFELGAGLGAIYKILAIGNTVLKVDGIVQIGTAIDVEAEFIRFAVVPEYQALIVYPPAVNGITSAAEFNLQEYTLTQAQYEKMTISNSNADGELGGYSVAAQVVGGGVASEEYRKTVLIAFGEVTNASESDDNALIHGDGRIEILNGGGGNDTLKLVADLAGSTVGGVAYNYSFAILGNQLLLIEATDTAGDEVIQLIFMTGIERVEFADQTVDIADLEVGFLPLYETSLSPVHTGIKESFFKANDYNLGYSEDDLSSVGNVSAQPTDGDDTISINAGNTDLISTGLGNDDVTGSAGADNIQTGSGNDTVNGGVGDDVIDGGSGNDTLNGGADKDSIYGASGDDIINGGDGVNKLFGGLGDDEITDGVGDSQLFGGGGNDTLNGGDGEDVLFGGAGDDNLNGGLGNDSFSGGIGADEIDGGAGSDIINYIESRIGVQVDLGDGNAEEGGAAEGDILTNIENISGSLHNDILRGDDEINLINGYFGNDEIYGGDGADLLAGYFGQNKIYGEDGDDTLITGGGADLLDGGDGNDWASYNFNVFEEVGVNINLANGFGSGGVAGGDVLVSIENLIGTDYDDEFVGNDVANEFKAGEGLDEINGGDGIDKAHLNINVGTYTISKMAGKISIEFMEDGEDSTDILHAVELVEFTGGTVDLKDVWASLGAEQAKFADETEYLTWLTDVYEYEM